MWLLIVIVCSQGCGATNVEFKNRAACEAAKATISSDIGVLKYVYCFKKRIGGGSF